MENVTIVTRDCNGKRAYLILKWDEVCEYVDKHIASGNITDDDDEILMVLVGGYTVYSSLGSEPITWDDITGFFG